MSISQISYYQVQVIQELYASDKRDETFTTIMLNVN